MGNEARINLARFMLGRSELRLDEMYEFLRLLTTALASEKRWAKYAARSRQTNPSAKGERLSENMLEHLMDKMIIGAEMIAVEKSLLGHDGGHVALELDPGRLYLAFALYGFGIALRGDVALLDKRIEDLERETVAFEEMLPLFSGYALMYFRSAHDLSTERDRAMLSGKPLSGITTGGQFLWAVVMVSFLGKSLYEAKRGNFAFVNTFHNMKEDIDYLCRIFTSFRRKVEPHLAEIKKMMEEYPRWEERK